MFPMLSSRSSCFAPRLAVFALWLSMLCLSSVANAETHTVPTQYPTIQAAVNASVNGDTVLVADGTYSGDGNRDIDFNGKNITVTSVNGRTKTIIDCGGVASTDGSGNHRGFYLHTGETNPIINGLTIVNGYEDSNSVEAGAFGGGIYADSVGVTVTNCTITQSTALMDGGAIYANESALTLTNCKVAQNTALTEGGGIYANFSGTTLTNCTVFNNTSLNGSGLYASGSLTLTDCLFADNNGTGSFSRGGGIYNASNFSVAFLTDCLFSGNTARDGGGVYNATEGGVSLDHCIISQNRADSGGGGFYNAPSGSIGLTNCTVTGNTATGGGGGGINVGTMSMTNCVVTGNTATNIDGGGIGNVGMATITNCTFTGNTAPSNTGGGINDYGAATLSNTIFYSDSGGEIVGDNSMETVTTVNYCDVQGGYTGTGNIDADPLFVRNPNPTAMPPDYGDLHLQPGSPCLGAGTAMGAPTTTIDGYTRPNPPSIGAYELAPVPAPTNLTATAGPGKVTLSWTAPAGVSGAKYNLYRGTTSGGETLYYSNVPTTSFVNTIVTAGTKYYYTVKTVVGSQLSVASNEASATPTGGTVPAAPTNLKAVAGDTKVTLTWTAPAGTVTSYTLYRGTSATALTVYKSGLTTTSFTNALVTNGTTYYYAVAAVNSVGSSPQSAVVSATPLAVPSAPTHLTATASGGKITLNWTASTGTVSSYSVYRGTTSGGETFYKTANTSTTFVNSLVTKGTTYYYYIKALNASGTSAASNEASATP